MANLRAGLIGLGMMGRNHARNLRAIDGVDLVAVCDPAGDRLGIADGLPVFDRVEALIEFGIDYCVVAAPTELHESIGLLLAEAGVHALVEKPLATTTSASLRLAEAFESRGLVGGVGHIERYNPALQSMRARLENGDLGEMYQVATRRQGPFPGRIADVGVILDLGSHDIDLTAWVSQRRFEQVAARTASKSGRAHEDMLSATCQLSGSLISNHVVNWLTPTKERRTIVSGEKGMFVADTLTADLTFYGNGASHDAWGEIAQFGGVTEGDVIRYAIAKPEPLRTEHEQFRAAVLGKDGAAIVSMREGTEVVRVCQAMLESSKTGKFVGLSEL